MCGFAGILNNSFSLEREQLAGIAAEVRFRGPDHCGMRIYNEEFQPVERGLHAMFFNRLAIMDLDPRSNQPFEDDRYTLLFNGEIYNYQELKKILQQEGVQFGTTSDTEVLFQVLKKWSVGGLEKLNGMFAFCWIDRREKKFLIARDRVGIKPLYYRQERQAFIFGSELDSILRLSEKIPTLNALSVKQFLWMQFVPTPNTIVDEVFKLPPGHYISGDLNELQSIKQVKSHSYWDAYAQVSAGGDKSDPQQLENVLVDSLSRQMVADVPIGLFLSSGVDSSLLAALVNKHFTGHKPVNFFTVAFDEQTVSDESKDAVEFIGGFKNPALHSHVLSIDSTYIGERLDRMYDYFDEPFGDYASLLNWTISARAREFATVVLSGDGADELFWGYSRYSQWKNPGLQLPKGIKVPGGLTSSVKSFLPGKYWKMKEELEMEPDPVRRHFSLFLSPVLGNLKKQPIWDDPIWALEGVSAIRNRPDLSAVLDLKTYLSDAMLYKVDRASMAASLEVRVPYLDNTMIDYALALPFTEKSDEFFQHKSALKKLLQRLAPHYPINRAKKGFNFPLDQWLRFAWKDRVHASVNKESVASLGLDEKIYLPMVERYYTGDKKFTMAVWYLFNLALWNEKFKKISAVR